MKISVSALKLFKACRRAYELKYVEGLEPLEKATALATGISYHRRIELLYENGSIDYDASKEAAMAVAYSKYIFPGLNVKETEVWRERDLPGGGVLIGRLDGIAEDGSVVEHKTSSLGISEYEYNLQWDEQILAYMYLTGSRKTYFTICKKPSIRKKKNESDGEFFKRVLEWYDEFTDEKLAMLTLTRTDEEVEAFASETSKLASIIENCDNFYRNTAYCNHWGSRCEYAPICLTYVHGCTCAGFTGRMRNDENENEKNDLGWS